MLLAPNPGPMTLDGTRSYVLAAPGAHARGRRPRPDDVAHLVALAAGPRVEVVLVTHRHADHTAGGPLRRAHWRAGPRRRSRSLPCRPHSRGRAAARRRDDPRGRAPDRRPRDPGHTGDSTSFHLPDDGPHGSVLTGDTILGRGTTVIAEPDGSLRDYLASLDLLESFGAATVLPAHGPHLGDLSAVVRAYREHRLSRLAQVRAVLAAAGLVGAPVTEVLVDAVTAEVYGDVAPVVLPAARQSVAAQLRFLVEDT
ncbi:MBL fold metallo-hydrolase [Oerskovia sp. M15]